MVGPREAGGLLAAFSRARGYGARRSLDPGVARGTREAALERREGIDAFALVSRGTLPVLAFGKEVGRGGTDRSSDESYERRERVGDVVKVLPES